MKQALLLSIIWLVLVNVLAVIISQKFTFGLDKTYWWTDQFYQQAQNKEFFSLHSRWDSAWYLDIAENGYSYQGVGKLSNVVFFPLYPLLLSLTSRGIGLNFVATGWVLSSLFLVGSLVYLYKLVHKFHPTTGFTQTAILLLVFPTAFFLNTLYTESLFLFLSITAFYYILQKHFFLAGFLGMLAALTRPAGICLFLPFVWELYQSNPGWKKLLNFKLGFLLLIPLGLLAFFFLHLYQFNNLFLFLEVEKQWGRGFGLDQDYFNLATLGAKVNFSLDLLFALIALTGSLMVWIKLRASYGIYMLSSLFLTLSSGTLLSVGRYTLVFFPLFILLATMKNNFFKFSWLTISSLLLIRYLALFVGGQWAG